MKIENYAQLRNEMDMVDGNMARMCITSSTEELEGMLYYALERINAIYNYNLKRLKANEEKNQF